MISKVMKTLKEGKISEKIPMFHTHILESLPDKIVHNHFAAIGDAEISIQDIPSHPISDDKDVEEFISKANTELGKMAEIHGKPKCRSADELEPVTYRVDSDIL